MSASRRSSKPASPFRSQPSSKRARRFAWTRLKVATSNAQSNHAPKAAPPRNFEGPLRPRNNHSNTRRLRAFNILRRAFRADWRIRTARMKRFDLWMGIAIGLALITTSWRRWTAFGLTEALGFISGAACVYPVVRQSVWNFSLVVADTWANVRGNVKIMFRPLAAILFSL